MAQETHSGPLHGVKVIELGTMITAPYAGMLLGELGASVIKVENPDGGDPFRATSGGNYGPNFIAYNHGKRSIAHRALLDHRLRHHRALQESPGL
jgi:formyl-CoA transferase